MAIRTTIALAALVANFAFHSAFAQLAEPNEDGVTYGHVHLNVSDIERHTQIWTEHFGGELVVKGPLTSVKLPNVVIIFSEREAQPVSRETVMDHFGFKVRNLQRFLDKWEAAGLPVNAVFTGAERQANAYVTLPDGAYVELQEDQALPVEVSGYHIHYYTEQPEELLAWYNELLNTETRPRGSIDTTTNLPGMNLSFSRAEGRLPTRGSSIDHIGFEVADLQGYIAYLESKGIALDVDYRDIPSIGLKIAFFTDPVGTYIELTEGLVDY